MLLINRTLLIVLAILVITASLGAGWFGYQQILGSVDLSSEAIRFQAESFLFYFIVTAVVLITGFGFLLFRVHHVDRQLDKLIEMSRYSDIYPSKHFAGLGPLGEKLKLIYRQINSLNIRKTMKISALSNLNEFLLNNISLPLVVTDVVGTILYSNSAFADKLKTTRGDLKSRKIDKVFTDLNIPVLMLELSRQHIPLETNSNNTSITCYPVHNVSAEMNYAIFVPEKKAAYSSLHKAGNDVVKKSNSLAHRLTKMMAKRK